MTAFHLKRIARTPLSELWSDEGELEATRVRDLESADIRAMLRQGPVRFMVAFVGDKPNWIPVADCYRFWKSEVRDHVWDDGRQPYEFPGRYAYGAEEWAADDGPPIIVLTRYS
jgi:hypothetical protein